MKNQCMSLAFNIVNICDINTHHTTFYIYHNNLCLSLFHTFDRAIQSLGERKIRNWFQHIIQRVYRITSNCILCHVCNKDDYNFTVHFTDFFRSGHSIHEFHLDIHKDNVELRFVFIDNLISIGINGYLERFLILCLVLMQKFFQLFCIHCFIFYNRNFDHLNPPPTIFLYIIKDFFIYLKSLLRFI